MPRGLFLGVLLPFLPAVSSWSSLLSLWCYLMEDAGENKSAATASKQQSWVTPPAGEGWWLWESTLALFSAGTRRKWGLSHANWLKTEPKKHFLFVPGLFNDISTSTNTRTQLLFLEGILSSPKFETSWGKEESGRWRWRCSPYCLL